jgi:crotonobetainyl-CoA:carnitine CoA-transferase CaiB-like acyl-CoA transferase
MSGALNGIRAIDFGQYIAGPVVTQMLSDQGADVIRIDPPGGPRWQADANAALQRGKRSIVLDLKHAAEVSIARKLIHAADVVVENFRPGVMSRLGLGPVVSMREHPQLSGSRDLDPTADPIYNTLPLASSFAALIAAISIVAALIARQRAGFGQRIEVSLFDAAFELTRYYGHRGPGAPYPRIRLGATSTMALTHHYACRDGRNVHLSWLEGRQLEAFVRLVGLADDWESRGVA